MESNETISSAGLFSADQHRTALVADCRIITLCSIPNEQGTLTVVENSSKLPFAIRRIYYLYDVPTGAERGGHSHYREERLLVAAAGCFDVRVSDGLQWRTFTLRSPKEALYIPAGLWRVLDNFSSGSICLALSSMRYDAADYVRSYSKFLELSVPKINEKQ